MANKKQNSGETPPATESNGVRGKKITSIELIGMLDKYCTHGGPVANLASTTVILIKERDELLANSKEIAEEIKGNLRRLKKVNKAINSLSEES